MLFAFAFDRRHRFHDLTCTTTQCDLWLFQARTLKMRGCLHNASSHKEQRGTWHVFFTLSPWIQHTSGEWAFPLVHYLFYVFFTFLHTLFVILQQDFHSHHTHRQRREDEWRGCHTCYSAQQALLGASVLLNNAHIILSYCPSGTWTSDLQVLRLSYSGATAAPEMDAKIECLKLFLFECVCVCVSECVSWWCDSMYN